MINKFSNATPSERKSYLLQRWEDLKQKRQPWYEKWVDVSRYISPFSGRFSASDHGDTRDLNLIFDAEATQDLKILASGLMSGASSPARPWFSIAPTDENLRQSDEVMRYCAYVQDVLYKTFQGTNTYNTLHYIYHELALFGVAADIIYFDPLQGIRHHPLTAGEYCLATDHNGDVDTIYREFELTTIQAVKQFGYDNVSREIRQAYDDGALGTYFTFIHAIEPREDRDIKRKDKKNMPWANYYFEQNGDPDRLTHEGGFKVFPVLTPRWNVMGVEAYGESPSILELPDVKQLQHETVVKADLLDKMVEPPLQVPQSARSEQISLSAGAINYTAATGTDQMVKPIFTTIGDINSLREDIEQIRQAIRRGYYVDLFMIVQQTAGDRRTTVEINALQQEQMLTLGPVVERNQTECLGKLVELTYHYLTENELLPPGPPELQGAALNIDYQSVLASAQKAVDINAVDRFFSAIANAGQIVPEVYDRLNPDGLVDEYLKRIGVAPQIVRSVEEAQEIRQQRAQAQARQQQMAEQQVQAQTAETMAQAQQLGAEASATAQSLQPIAGGMPF